MSKQANIDAQKRFGEVVQNGRFEQLSELVSESVVDHDPAPGQGPGPQGYVDFFRTLGTAFPDMHIAIDHLVADDDNVAFAYMLTGTHKGPFMGVAATGRRIKARGMQISRFENGKMVERWGSSDELGILKQIDGASAIG